MSRKEAVLGRIVRSVAEAERPAATDRELLRRYVGGNDEAAFAALVARHTAMVFGVCRRALPTVQDAEDACQATFLVLAGKAASGRWRASVANWLYTTARKVAHNARVAAERRTKREAAAAVSGSVEPVDRMTGRELLAALDEELDRLPDLYREPLVLCYLEGLTVEDAAGRLGVPASTIKTRVSRGRKRLHEALTKGGCGLGAGLLALAVASPAGAAPPRLVQSILTAVSGSPPAAVGELAKGVAVNGVLNKSVLALAVVGVIALGVGLGSIGASTARPTPGTVPSKVGGPADAGPSRKVPELPVAQPGVDPSGSVTVNGRVLGPDGKPIAGAKLYLGYTGPKDMKYPVRATSGDDGRFKFTIEKSELDGIDSDDRTIQVMAVAEGHGCDWAPVGPAGDELTLRLVKDLPIAVRILDPEGKPLAGAKLTVTSVSAAKGEDLGGYIEEARKSGGYALGKYWSGPLPGQPAVVTTGADGRFKLAGAGRERVVRLRIEGPGIASSGLDVMTRDVESVKHPKEGWTHTYGASSDYVAHASRPIRGVVRAKETGKPLAGVTVEHYHGQGPSALTDKEGRYELLGLAKARDYALNVKPADGLYFQRRVVVEDTPGLGAMTCDIELVRGLTVRGRVTDKETGKPAAGAKVDYHPLGGNSYADKLLPGSWDPRAETVTGADGSYAITVMPGPGVIGVQAPRLAAYMPAAVPLQERRDFFATRLVDDKDEDGFTRYAGGGSYGGIGLDAYNAVVLLEPGEKEESLVKDVALERPQERKGRVVGPDGQPLTGVTVIGLLAHFPRRSRAETLKGDEFSVRGINPKANRPLVFYHKEMNLGFFLKDLRGEAPGPLTVKLQPCGSASGRVVDQDGQPVAVLRLHVSGQALRSFSGGQLVTTDKDGRFRVEGLVPGLNYAVSELGGGPILRIFAPVVVEPGKHKDMGEIKRDPEIK